MNWTGSRVLKRGTIKCDVLLFPYKNFTPFIKTKKISFVQLMSFLKVWVAKPIFQRAEPEWPRACLRAVSRKHAPPVRDNYL